MIGSGYGDPAASRGEDVANAVSGAAKMGRRVIDKIVYQEAQNTLVIVCGSLWLSIDINTIPELSGIPADELRLIDLSPGGATIQIERLNLYIEAATLVIDEINRLFTRKESSGLIEDVLRKSRRRTT